MEMKDSARVYSFFCSSNPTPRWSISMKCCIPYWLFFPKTMMLVEGAEWAAAVGCWAGGSSLHPVPARASEDFCPANLANMGSPGLTCSVLLLSCTGGTSECSFTLSLLGVMRVFISPGSPGVLLQWSGLLGWFDPGQELDSRRAVLGHKSV